MQYTTAFPLTENPISEGGKWNNATDSGLNNGFAAVQTTGGTPGFAWATSQNGGPDPTAWLKGTWGQYQNVQGTIEVINNTPQEVELLSNFFATPGSPGAGTLSGYEWDISNQFQGGNGIFNFVRYDGNGNGNNSYTFLVGGNGAGGAAFDFGRQLVTGDVLMIKNQGTGGNNSFHFYLNGVELTDARFPVVDNTYTAGAPGIGMFIDSGANFSGDGDVVWSSFSATDDGFVESQMTNPTSHRMVGRKHV